MNTWLKKVNRETEENNETWRKELVKVNVDLLN